MSDFETFEPMTLVEPEPAAALANIEPRVSKHNGLIAAPWPAGYAKPRTLREVRAELRARLRAVNAEIRARKGLEAERDQIKRLLSAARKPKTPTVRAIRAAG